MKATLGKARPRTLAESVHKLGNTAVAERVAAETDLPVKRRSSFEPEAAEEVKEDDKEDEKKGFSMWESISRSVTPPAPSGTESPIQVKIEE